ncbi:MAG: ABC transporter permease [Zetaproteobacteria bacterium]|nr:ABC transporter permease [Zetaproteobacteria bacterium]
MSGMNILGTWTLFQRESKRFMRVKMQTIVAPALTAILYLIVFRYAMGERQVPGLNVDYFTFLIPGLMMMAMLQNAFANTSSSMIMGKIMNTHVFLMMAPISPIEAMIAFLSAAVLRALVVGGVLLLVLFPFSDLHITHVWMILFYGVCGSLIMGSLGLITGMWSKTFDEMSMVTNFIIMPLTFLSGVFYSVKQLPPIWQALNAWNPFFYLIDGFRHGFIATGDSDPVHAIGMVLVVTLSSVILAWYLWRIGWKLKD